MERAFCFSAIASKEKIDAEKGIIYGVSVITEGEAKGHKSFIDKITLSQINNVAKEIKDGVKVKLSEAKEHDGSAGQIVGSLKNFRIDGAHIRADLHLLKNSSKYGFILELAAEMPSAFGLSVVVPNETETIDGEKYLRCSEIYSIDLVEAPAANAGLFSSKTMSKEIKYANGKDGDHDEACECKECMSKHSKKEMTAMLASLIGLSEKATEDEIKTALAAGKSGDTAELSKKITDLTTELSAFKTEKANAVALAKKAEIDNLIAEAGRDGKVIPMDADDIYTVKDGVCSIKIEPAQLSKMIQKLTKGQVQLARKTVELPKTKEGHRIDKRSPEFVEFCRTKAAEGAIQLSQKYAEIN